MKFKMSEKSLFAILLRSPWWISFALMATFSLVSVVLLPAQYTAVGMMGGFPFLVIGLMAAWRQRNAPDPARVAELLARAAVMSWSDFSDSLERAFQRQGFSVTRLKGVGADFQLEKGGRITVVSCKRWKAATHGVDSLRELVAQKQALGADQLTYIGLGQITDQARRFADSEGIALMPEAELAQLFLQNA